MLALLGDGEITLAELQRLQEAIANAADDAPSLDEADVSATLKRKGATR